MKINQYGRVMEEIKKFEDLDSLRQKISTVRSKCKVQPDLEFRSGFIHKVLMIKDPQSEQCNKHNEQIYSELPREILVDSTTGELLLNRFTDFLKARKSIQDQRPEQSSFDAIVQFGRIVSAVLVPSPATIGSLAVSIGKGMSEMNAHENAMKELLKKTDKNIKEILGSYQLTKKADGAFILKRGAWFVHEEITEYAGPQGSKIEKSKYYSALKDVGVDPSILDPEVRTLLTASYPAWSANVSHWER
jgi:hypothetical protein